MNETQPKILVSVDDFGISEETNKNILALIASNKIDRVSVMMNGIITTEEVQILLESGVKLDIHLDRKHIIQENRKLADGFWRRFTEFIWSYFFGSNRPSQVERVWHNQLRKFEDIFGKKPDGLNAHEHVHYFPPYFRVLLQLAEEYDISYIRLGYKNTKNYTLVAFVINLLRSLNRKALRQSGKESADRVLSFDWISHKGSFVDFQSSLEKGTVTEVIFHPERQEEFVYMQNFL